MSTDFGVKVFSFFYTFTNRSIRMDLFYIDRYMGDDQEAESEHDQTSKFTRLQLEIEDRKRKRKSVECNSSVLVNLSNSETAEDGNGKQPNEDEPYVEEKKAKNESSSTETEKKSTRRLSESTLQKKARYDKDVKLCTEQSNCVMDGKDKSGKRKEKKKKKKREKDDSKEKKDSEKEKDVEEEDISKKNATEKTKSTGFTVIGGQNKNKVEKRVQRVLPDWLAKPTIINTDLRISLVPVEEMSCLGPYLISILHCHNIDHLFPVQSVVIPAVLSQIDTNSCFGKGGYQPSDICVSAPTGSGKTLAYVLPIVKSLLRRVVCHLRALILLPTKDLASQVKQVFEMFTAGTSLRVGLASGSKSVSRDEEQLTDPSSFGSTSRVDILVCTPGRLVDHISSTPHFTLQHVRFLVIDEADRLLGQSYHGWLAKVLRAAYNSHFSTTDIGNIRSVSCDLQTIRSSPGPQTAASFSTIQLPLQKLLFSATMTLSPEKLAPLQLFQPVLFTAAGTGNQATTADAVSVGRYTIPEGLSEYMTVCNNGEKPLVVLYYLIELNFQGVLCFSSSLEATHRLYLLVKLYGGVEVAEYSSSLTPTQRKGILRDFKLGKVQLLVCSDAMARGMDIQRVRYVISYDVPNFVKGYVHRVGRTARAGNEGTAITLLHRDEVHHFKELIYKTGRKKIPKYNIKQDKLHAMVDKYQETLARLQETVKMESQNKRQRKQGTENVVKVLQEQLVSNLLQKSV